MSEYIPVPSMEQIVAIPKNGLRLVSTFTGCGGSCLGFRLAGYETLWASEFIAPARETYRLNFPGVYVDDRDIRDVAPEDILQQTGLAVGECDVLEGSPPCASFSTAGKREAGWNKVKQYSETKQRVDDLFFEFIRILAGVQPKVFVAENVKGLVIGKAKGYFKQIHTAMKEAGYRVSCRVLDAQFFGVPQHRERAVFVGVREDLGIEPSHPPPQAKPVPLKAALPNIIRFRVGGGPDKWKSANNPMDTVVQSGAELSETAYLSANGFCETDISRYAIGAEWDKLKPGEQSGRYFQLVKADPDKPCGTILQTTGSILLAAGVTHPYEKRKFTIAELKRICGFPDDFQLTGTYAQQWERLGRAVPPPMMQAIAEHIRDTILASD